MKPYPERNDYEILDVPMDASPLEIRRAFQDALELYQSDSLVSYSFFGEAERKEILALLEQAYLNLINDESRSAYDRLLIEKGIMEEGQRYRDKSKVPLTIYGSQKNRLPNPRLNTSDSLDTLGAASNDMVQRLLDKQMLNGSDLKAIRTALGVPLDKIAHESKIKPAILQAIEEDDYDRLPPQAYLKGFVKLYARCLRIDDDKVIRAYLSYQQQIHLEQSSERSQ